MNNENYRQALQTLSGLADKLEELEKIVTKQEEIIENRDNMIASLLERLSVYEAVSIM